MIKDCPLCTSPPQTFVFDIVDNVSGENLFSNGTYKVADFQIKNVLNQQVLDFSLIEEDGLGYISLYSIGWQTEVVNCHFYYQDEELFTLYVDAVRKSEDCCSFTDYNAIELEGKEFEQIKDKGVYVVYIPR
jgi:hypothetical protein